MTKKEYEACQASDLSSLTVAIEAVTLKALEAGTRSIDYEAAVNSEWQRMGMDELLDKRVDLAVEEVRSETSWSDLAQSLVSKETAQKLATKVAKRVYQSKIVEEAITSLATGVGKKVGETIELASIDSSGPAIECLRAFLGSRYGTTVAGVVTGDVEKEFGVKSVTGGASVSTGAVLSHSSAGITGAAILIVRRQLANMAARIGQRLAGSVLSRLVSVVAGGVGLVLIAKDLWELRNGVLPIIADEMKSPATKEKVRAELASSLAEQIKSHVREIAASSAKRVAEIWQDFQRAHQTVLDIASRHAAFRAFVDTVNPSDLPRLDEVTGLVVAADGEQGVLRRLASGKLSEAVRFMPDAGMIIARETRSIDEALAWTSLAGSKLDKVIEHEIYRTAQPKNFTRQSLSRLLAVDDHLVIVRLSALDLASREKLFALDAEELKRLARTFSEAELTTLAAYLTGLGEEPRQRVLSAIAQSPGKMQVLSAIRVREAVISSADQRAAVDMMLRDGGGSARLIASDFQAAWDGRIAPILIWEKHPLSVMLLAAVGIFALLLMRRLFAQRRKNQPKPPVQEEPSA